MAFISLGYTDREGETGQFYCEYLSCVGSKRCIQIKSQLDDVCKKLEHHGNLGVLKLCESVFRPKIKSRYEVLLADSIAILAV